MKEKRFTEKGFTLAELLIVVAIIGVLVAVSIPIFSGQLEKARQATDMANMRSAKAAAVAEWLTGSMSKDENYVYDAASGRVYPSGDMIPAGYGKSSKNASEFADNLNATGYPNEDGEANYITVSVKSDGLVSMHWGSTLGSIWASYGSTGNNTINGGRYSSANAKNAKTALMATDNSERKKADQDAMNFIAAYFTGKSLEEVKTILGTGKLNSLHANSTSLDTNLFEYSVAKNGEIRLKNMPADTSFLNELGYVPNVYNGSSITSGEYSANPNTNYYVNEYLFKSNEMITGTNSDGDYTNNRKNINLKITIANGVITSAQVYAKDASGNTVNLD